MIRYMRKTACVATTLLVSTPVTVFAQSIDPHALSMYKLAVTAFQQDSKESAIIFLKRAITIDPRFADAQYKLGTIYQAQRRDKEAISRFLDVLKIRSNDSNAHFQLGVLYQTCGQLADAKKHLSAIGLSDPLFPQAQNNIAQIDTQLTNAPSDINAVTRQ